MLPVEGAGEPLLLHPERALFWPARATLVIADPHFGKDEVFRRAGLAIPAGVLSDDLGRLDRLLEECGATRLVVLGDFFHAPPSADATFLRELAGWRAARRALSVEVVAGNHDRGVVAASLRGLAAWHDAPLADPPFVFAHEPPGNAAGYTLCGHLHPAVRLRDAGATVRLAAFWFRPDHAVLPAFGGFTGAAPIRARPGDRVFAVTGSTVHELPPRRPAKRRTRKKERARW